MTGAEGAAAVLAVAAAALLAGLAPQRLLAGLRDGPTPRGAGWGLSLAAAAAGLATLAVAARFAPPGAATGLALLAVTLTAMALIDLTWLVIPDLHVAMVAALALVGPLAPPLVEAASGAALAGGLLWLVRFGYQRLRGREGLGLGDVKLMAAIGALVGPHDVLWVLVGGAFIGIVLILSGRAAAGGMAPLGAAVAAPALVAACLARWPG